MGVKISEKIISHIEDRVVKFLTITLFPYQSPKIFQFLTDIYGFTNFGVIV
mgnify:CR=1 FL=1